MRRSPHHIARTVMVGAVAVCLALPAAASAWHAPRSGGLGHQLLRGGPGPDFLRGAEGPDTVRGNGGADLLTGDSGPDDVFGGAGSDTIVGGAGIDELSGGPGNDVISGGFGADVIDGGSGDDALDGGNDADTLTGGDGNDVLHGGSGVDSLDGGAGNDRLFADSGGDTIVGGPGDDVVVVEASAYAHVDCGPGDDTLYITTVADAISDYAGRGSLTRYTGCETVELTDALSDPDKGVTYLAPDKGGARTGTARDDTLLGGPGPDTLRGGAGNDVLWGLRQPDVPSSQTDVLDGGAGDDTIYGGPGRQRIFGGPGDDYLESGVGNGTIHGGAGDDTIRLRGGGLTRIDAGSGNDTIYARGAPRAIISCGPGRDVANADSGDRVARDCERVVGGAKRPKRARTRTANAAALQATPGLVHRWRLDDAVTSAAGTVIHDQIGGAGGYYYGDLGAAGVTDDGDTAFETHVRGTFYDGDGNITLGVSDDALHHPFTFEAWFRPDDSGVARAMLTDTTLGTSDGVVLVHEADGSLHAIVNAGSASTPTHAEARTAPLGLVPGSWHHVALTLSDDRLAIYVDGAPAAQAPAPPMSFSSTTDAIGVGQQFALVPNWVGGIDEIALYDRALDAATIHAHAFAGDDGSPPVARADPPIPPAQGRAATIGLSTGKAGASFRCSLDGAAYTPCRPTVALNDLSDGSHTLSVLATSRVGVSQVTPTVLRFRIDNALPGTLLVVRVSPDGDDRAIATFGSSDAASFECRHYTTFDVGSSFGWTPCTPPMDVQRGLPFQVRAVDDVGNRDPTPASLDIPGPGRSFDYTSGLPTFAGAQANARIVGDPPFAGSYQCRIDGRAWAACPSTLRLPILDPGPHALQVRQSIGARTLTTVPMTWDVGTPAGNTRIAGMQSQLVVEHDARLKRRAPTVRFALDVPAAVQVAVLARGKRPRIVVAASGRAGANVVALPSRRLYALGSGRFTIRLTARAASGAPAIQQLPLAIVPALR